MVQVEGASHKPARCKLHAPPGQATYDIFVTAVTLAGGALPKLALDGRDLSQVPFNAAHDLSPEM